MQVIKKVCFAAAMAAVAGCGGLSDGGSSVRFLQGEMQVVNGARVQTYARLAGPVVREAGVVVPFSLIENPPETGTGPAGSFIHLQYPNIVAQTTIFNHFEMHWEPNGHPPEVFSVPHFDIHSYTIPESAVRTIFPPDDAPPAADRIPQGYVYPGVDQAVPEMGVHAVNPVDLAPPFTAVMILGYWHGAMDFVEPMVTREKLMLKQSFTMDIPVPARFGRTTRYPTHFRAVYQASSNSYWFIFDNFVDVN